MAAFPEDIDGFLSELEGGGTATQVAPETGLSAKSRPFPPDIDDFLSGMEQQAVKPVQPTTQKASGVAEEPSTNSEPIESMQFDPMMVESNVPQYVPSLEDEAPIESKQKHSRPQEWISAPKEREAPGLAETISNWWKGESVGGDRETPGLGLTQLMPTAGWAHRTAVAGANKRYSKNAYKHIFSKVDVADLVWQETGVPRNIAFPGVDDKTIRDFYAHKSKRADKKLIERDNLYQKKRQDRGKPTFLARTAEMILDQPKFWTMMAFGPWGFAPEVITEYKERRSPQVLFTEKGTKVTKDVENVWASMWKASAGSAIEYTSERFLGKLLDRGSRRMLITSRKALSLPKRKAVRYVMKALKPKGTFANTIKKMRKTVHFDSISGEMFEELGAGLARASLNLDDMKDPETGKPLNIADRQVSAVMDWIDSIPEMALSFAVPIAAGSAIGHMGRKPSMTAMDKRYMEVKGESIPPSTSSIEKAPPIEPGPVQEIAFTQPEEPQADAGGDRTALPVAEGVEKPTVEAKTSFVKDVKSNIVKDPLYEYGLRIIQDGNADPKIGDTLKPSTRWIDNMPTEELLDGVSTIGVSEKSIDRDIKNLQDKGYLGNKIVLVKGEESSPGEDVGETVIKNAEVVGVWNRGDLTKTPTPQERPKPDAGAAKAAGEGAKPSVPKEISDAATEFNDDLETQATDVAGGRAFGRTPVRDEQGNIIRWQNAGSVYAEGWGGRDGAARRKMLQRAVANIKSGKPLTDKQRIVMEDAAKSRDDEDSKKYGPIPETGDEKVASIEYSGKQKETLLGEDIPDNALVYYKYEWHKAEKLPFGGVTLKDGKSVSVESFDTLEVKGMIEPGNFGYEEAAKEYAIQEKGRAKKEGREPFDLESVTDEQVQDEKKVKNTKEKIRERIDKPLKGDAGDLSGDLFDARENAMPLFAEAVRKKPTPPAKKAKTTTKEPVSKTAQTEPVANAGEKVQAIDMMSKEQIDKHYEKEMDDDHNEIEKKLLKRFYSQKGLEGKRADGTQLFTITKSVKQKNKIQYTSFDKNGTPFGDTPYPLTKKGIIAAIQDNGLFDIYRRKDIPDTAGLGKRGKFAHVYKLKSLRYGTSTMPYPKKVKIIDALTIEYPFLLSKKNISDFELEPIGYREVKSVQALTVPEAVQQGKPVKAPKGATFLRVTDAEGRKSVVPVKDVDTLTDAGPFTKIEFGTQGKKGFVAMGEKGVKDKPITKGVGAAAARSTGEFAPKGKVDAIGVTGVSKRFLEPEREGLGLPKESDLKTRKHTTALDDAKQILEDNPNAGNELVTDLLKGGRVIEDTDVALLNIEKNNRFQVRNNAYSKTVAISESGSEDQKAKAQKESEVAQERLEEVFTVLESGEDKFKTIMGRSISALKMALDEKHSLVEMEQAIRTKQKNEALSEVQRAELEQLKKDYDRAKEENKRHTERLEQEVSDREREYASLQAEAELGLMIKEFIDKGKKKVMFSSKLKKATSKRANAARERMKKRMGRTSAGVDPTLILDLTNIAIDYIVSGVQAFEVWSEKMVKEYGSHIRKHLKEVERKAWARAIEEDAILGGQEASVKTNKAGKARDTGIKKLYRDQVEMGLTSLKKITNNVQKILADSGVDMTYAEVMDAFSDYGKTSKSNRTRADSIIADLRRQAQLYASIDRLANKLAPLRSGKRRDPDSPLVRKLTKQLKKMMKEAGIEVTDKNKQLATALSGIKTRLTNDIEDLDNAINTGNELIKDSNPVLYDDEAKRLKAKRDKLRVTYDSIFTKKGLTDKQRVDIAIKLTERSIDVWNKALVNAKKGIFGAIRDKVKPTPKDGRLRILKIQRDALKAEVKRLKDIANPKLSPELMAIRNKKRRAITGIKEMQRRIREKDYAPKTRNEIDISSDPEAMAAQIEFEAQKIEFAKMKERARRDARSIQEVIKESGAEVFHTQRNLLASVDLSAPGRQGFYYTLSHPIKGVRAYKLMFKSLSKAQSAAIYKQQQNLPNAKNGIHKKAGLDLSPGDGTGDFTSVQDAHKLEIANRVPGVAMSNRAYATFLNTIRIDWFDSMLAQSKDPADVETQKAVASLVNMLTGSGSVGTHAPTLSKILFAPRFVAAQLSMSTGGGLIRGGTRETKLMALKEYVRMAGMIGLIYSLAAMFGREDEEIELDPRSSKFGSINIGPFSINPLGFSRRMLTFLARLVSGQTKTINGTRNLRSTWLPFATEAQKKEKVLFYSDMDDTLWRFLKGKAHPFSGTAIMAATGKTFSGPTPTGIDYIKSLAAPIAPREVGQAFGISDDDMDMATVMSILIMLGMDVQPQYNHPKVKEYQKKQKEKRGKKKSSSEPNTAWY